MITAVVAVRAGSQRVKNKNIKPFGDSNLLEIKLKTLQSVKNIDEIIVNSDSEEMLQIARGYGVQCHRRDDYFASSEATNSEFHGHIAEVTDSDTIFLAPVCSPFVSVESHEKAIDYYLNNDFDSVTSVTEIKNHLWLDGKPLNYDLNNVPNSQDLPDVVKLNYGITIIDRDVMRKEKRVVGNNPGFYKLNEIESVDIDTEFDFFIAEQINSKNMGR
jgi:CMP-N-acetylneuraminic acid synthetase